MILLSYYLFLSLEYKNNGIFFKDIILKIDYYYFWFYYINPIQLIFPIILIINYLIIINNN